MAAIQNFSFRCSLIVGELPSQYGPEFAHGFAFDVV